MGKLDTMGKDALNRVEEIINSTKLNDFLHRKEEEEKKKKRRRQPPKHGKEHGDFSRVSEKVVDVV